MHSLLAVKAEGYNSHAEIFLSRPTDFFRLAQRTASLLETPVKLPAVSIR